MKTFKQSLTSVLASLAVAVGGVTLSVAPIEAEAKRLGGSRPAGMQRQMPAKQPTQPTQNQGTSPQQGAPAQQPANAAAAGAAGAAAGDA